MVVPFLDVSLDLSCASTSTVIKRLADLVQNDRHAMLQAWPAVLTLKPIDHGLRSRKDRALRGSSLNQNHLEAWTSFSWLKCRESVKFAGSDLKRVKSMSFFMHDTFVERVFQDMYENSAHSKGLFDLDCSRTT